MAKMPAPVKALYYPHIHFRSVEFLKCSLLYWEGVNRIVPRDFQPDDPPEVKALIDAGLVTNVAPDE